MSNPFEEPSSNQNPWSSPSANSNGPLYGNAYESTNISSASPALPPRKPANNTASSPYGTQRMPSPSDYANNTPVVNAWQESNKTLDEQEFGRNSPQQPVNAYQYTGTAYGNTSTPATAYSPQPVHNNAANTTSKIETPMTVTDSPATVNRADLPSKIRLLLRVVLFISAVGHLGFAAGASPFSGEGVPFDSSACFYFLFAVAIMSIIYSGYHIIFYFFRRFGKADKMKRVIMIMCDLLMALLWGIGIIVEIAKYTCPPGQHSGWCNFYNTSIFFGFISFVIYVVLLGWDAFGGMCGGKRD
ncbi:hypothetical protein FB192DRAFT_1380282 [Mucor lusitanicus]|uniref:MARVEL domain-containing protein n=2 Tax=Mucor circinelloides f. lusitanicus TaxID=29924 RepID=A0A168QH45_MUCCL|nr:hypothetical protein FB192DRAFT_1380282 [Mucor lusitanicus]OAD09229.1 hypothetical protein MUCCIDRAFT_155125 [Mucor lusitanicus CBS 277.49]